MITYETNNKYLMHYNKNHDKLGRFAKSNSTTSINDKKKSNKQSNGYLKEQAKKILDDNTKLTKMLEKSKKKHKISYDELKEMSKLSDKIVRDYMHYTKKYKVDNKLSNTLYKELKTNTTEAYRFNLNEIDNAMRENGVNKKDVHIFLDSGGNVEAVRYKDNLIYYDI